MTGRPPRAARAAMRVNSACSAELNVHASPVVRADHERCGAMHDLQVAKPLEGLVIDPVILGERCR